MENRRLTRREYNFQLKEVNRENKWLYRLFIIATYLFLTAVFAFGITSIIFFHHIKRFSSIHSCEVLRFRADNKLITTAFCKDFDMAQSWFATEQPQLINTTTLGRSKTMNCTIYMKNNGDEKAKMKIGADYDMVNSMKESRQIEQMLLIIFLVLSVMLYKLHRVLKQQYFIVVNAHMNSLDLSNTENSQIASLLQ